MKKIKLLICGSLLCFMANSQNVPIDFESGGNGANWTWTVFENDINPPLEIVSNPDMTGINTSATVAKFTALQAGQPWAGLESMHGSDIGTFTVDATNATFKIMVWKSVISDVGLKLAAADGSALPEVKVPNTLTNEWEELTFDLSNLIGLTYDQIIVFPDFQGRTMDNVVYFDNVSTDSSSVSTVTNDITYQVDMNGEIAAGNFNPLTEVVFVTGGNANPPMPYSFCGEAMSDVDGDGIYDLTRAYASNALINYKFHTGPITFVNSNFCDGGNPGYEPNLPAPCGFGAFGDREHDVAASDAVLPVVCFGSCDATCGAPPVMVDYTFVVDMNCDPEVLRPPGITGPSWGWCSGCNVMTDVDGDDIWELTLTLNSGADLEYKYEVAAFAEQENLIDDMVAGATCAPITDFFGYANRLVTIDSVNTTINDSYGSCDDCMPVFCIQVLNITGVIPTATYNADDVIVSNGLVNSSSGGPVNFLAGANAGGSEYILLNSGFDADGTVDFSAINMECDSTD